MGKCWAASLSPFHPDEVKVLQKQQHPAYAPLNKDQHHWSNGFDSVLDRCWLLLHHQGHQHQADTWQEESLQLQWHWAAYICSVLCCDFSAAASQGLLRAQHTGDWRCCPASLLSAPSEGTQHLAGGPRWWVMSGLWLQISVKLRHECISGYLHVTFYYGKTEVSSTYKSGALFC